MLSQTRLSEPRTTYLLVSYVKFHIQPFSMAIYFLSRKMCSVSTPFSQYRRMHQRVIDSRPFKRKCAFIVKVLEVLLTQEKEEEEEEEEEGWGGGGEGEEEKGGEGERGRGGEGGEEYKKKEEEEQKKEEEKGKKKKEEKKK